MFPCTHPCQCDARARTDSLLSHLVHERTVLLPAAHIMTPLHLRQGNLWQILGERWLPVLQWIPPGPVNCPPCRRLGLTLDGGGRKDNAEVRIHSVGMYCTVHWALYPESHLRLALASTVYFAPCSLSVGPCSSASATHPWPIPLLGQSGRVGVGARKTGSRRERSCGPHRR